MKVNRELWMCIAPETSKLMTDEVNCDIKWLYDLLALYSKFTKEFFN